MDNVLKDKPLYDIIINNSKYGTKRGNAFDISFFMGENTK